MSVRIEGGKIFFKGAFCELDILIEDGRILKIGHKMKGDEKAIDARGMLVLPGLIDPHVHLREPGWEHKEDFKTGSQAAVAGGFTTIIDMPNNKIPTTTAVRLREKEELAAKKAVCNVRFHMGTTDSNFEEVRKANPDSLKIYMGKTTGELMLKEKSSLEKHLTNFDPERPIVLHAADDEKNEEKNLNNTYENEDHAISIATRLNRKVHLAHVSTSHEVNLFKKFAKATCEVAPHYLFLNSNDAERLGKLGTVYPQLRSEQKRLMLWNSLNQIDCIATDHAPHTIEDKDTGAHGFPGLETSLGLMLDAYNKGLLELDWIITRMSENPARIFNLLDKGKIEVGSEASFTIVDLKKEWTVEGNEQFTKCKWSPFDGKKLKGKVQSVIFKGEMIFEDGEFY